MSDNKLQNPMVMVRQEDAAQGTFGAAVPQLLPEAKNYADDPMMVKQVTVDLVPLIQWTRTRRTSLEDEWRAILRMDQMMHDTGRRYMGRSNSYLPVYQRINQTLVSALSRGLFPSDEYFDVVARSNNADVERAPRVKLYLQWEFERVAEVRKKIKPLLKQLVHFGTSPLKYDYKKKVRKEGGLKRMMAADPELTPGFRDVAAYEGLHISTQNLFHWYIYPETSPDIYSASLVFEDIPVGLDFVQDMVRKKRWMNGAQAMNAPIPTNFQTNEAELVTNAQGISDPVTPMFGNNPLGKQVVLTEAWTYLKFPKSAYLDGEDPEEAVPAKVVLAGGTPIEIIRNPYWHQCAPYLVARTNVQPGSFYGFGTGKTVRPLQYLANDFANQTNDCGAYALNPVVKVNPGLLAAPLKPLAPGVVWPMMDIQAGAMFDRPPVELIGAGQQMLSLWMGMAQDQGGAPPVVQGTGSGKGAKTATGAQILQRNAMAPLQDLVEDIEMDVMVPLLRGCWRNAQQFRDKAVMVAAADGPIEVTLEDLAIDAEFRWLASSQAVNQQQRMQSALGFLTAVVPLAEMLQAQGYTMNPEPLIKRMYVDGMGFRGYSDFIKRAPVQTGMPGMPPGAPPQGAPQTAQDRVRSALEQAAGGPSGDMVPGEGEDFMEVRNGADSLAAQAGGSNGG